MQIDTSYDGSADVLYVTWGNVPTTNGVEIATGVILRFTDSGRAAGFTIWDFCKGRHAQPQGVGAVDPVDGIATGSPRA